MKYVEKLEEKRTKQKSFDSAEEVLEATDKMQRASKSAESFERTQKV